MSTDLLDNTKTTGDDVSDIFGEDPNSSASNENDKLYQDDTGYGTSAVIKKIREWTNSNKPVITDIFLINVETIIRNNTTLDRDDKEIIDKTYSDVGELTQVICDYIQSVKQLLASPMIIFYFPDYVRIPAMHKRADSPTRKKIRNITNIIKKQDNIVVRKTIRNVVNGIEVYEIVAGDSGHTPPRAIEDFLRNMNKLNPLDLVASQKKFMMISHQASDYHLSRVFPHFQVLESFTGNVYNANSLGLKVFGNANIPFNSPTHMLFGDNNLILPMAKRKNRKLLMDLGVKQRWLMKPRAEIAKLVGATNQVPSQILMTPIFGY
jgi:hypothetical protein